MQYALSRYIPIVTRFSRLAFYYCVSGVLMWMAAIQASAQTQPSINLAQQMYVAYYGRPGDPGGVNYWAGQFDQSGNLDGVLSSFGNSQEYSDNYGSLSYRELVSGLFQQMFNRDPDSGGLDFYVGRLESGEATLASIAKQIADGTQGDDKAILTNKIVVANDFTHRVDVDGLSYTSEDIPAVRTMLQSVTAEPGTIPSGKTRVAVWVPSLILNQCSGCFKAEIDGPIVGGEISIATLRDPEIVLLQSRTLSTAELIADVGADTWNRASNVSRLSVMGTSVIDTSSLHDDSLYLVKVSGGEDADDDLDRVVDADFKTNPRSIHVIAKGAHLKDDLTARASIITELIYRSIEGQISQKTDSEIILHLEDSAQNMIVDHCAESPVSYETALKWSRLVDAESSYKKDINVLNIIADAVKDPAFENAALALEILSKKILITPDADGDNDGVNDHADAFPFDANEYADCDGDGVGDNEDEFPRSAARVSKAAIDIDGDGESDVSIGGDYKVEVASGNDDVVIDAQGNVDVDGDGDIDISIEGEEISIVQSSNYVVIFEDSDSDGIVDSVDDFPQDAAEKFDNDIDGIGDNSDEDDDNDSFSDDIDSSPIVEGSFGLISSIDFADSSLQDCVLDSANEAGKLYSEELVRLSCQDRQVNDLLGLEGFSSLVEVDLSYNEIGDISVLSNMTNMTTLYIQVNNISDMNPLGSLNNLTTLTIGTNNITDISVLGQMPNVTSLSVSYNDIDDVSVLSQLPSLRDVGFGYTAVSDISPLSELTTLKQLWVPSAQVSDLAPLSNLIYLTELVLENNEVTDVSPLAGLKNLRDVWMANNDITDFSALLGLQGLRFLDVSGNSTTIPCETIDAFRTNGVDVPYFEEQCPISDDANASDLDSDGDGVSDLLDKFPLDDSEYFDNDNDGIGDNGDSDDDNDGFTDDVDTHPWKSGSGSNTLISDVVFQDQILEDCIVNAAAAANTDFVEDMRSLTCTDINVSDITGLEEFTNLVELDLIYNNIRDITPLTHLTKLESLLINTNNVRDISPLANMKNLKRLWFGSNAISSIGVLKHLTQLTELQIGHNFFSDLSPLRDLNSLITLSLGYNKISDVSPLSQLVNLTSLEMYHNEIIDVSALGSLINLEHLFLSINPIGDISVLSQLVRLREVEIALLEISDLSPLFELPDLESLDIFGNDVLVPCEQVDTLIGQGVDVIPEGYGCE